MVVRVANLRHRA